MSRSTSGSTSSDLPKGKKFIKKLLYVQHVDKEKDTASEISERYLEEFLLTDRTDFIHDSNFTEYLKSPKANLSILKSSMKDLILKVKVYSNPLPIPLQLPGITFHAFVVFQTENHLNHKCTWWSLEKNGTYIVLQQSPNKDDVINKIYDTETKTSVERLGPIQKQKRDWAFKLVSDLMRIIVDTNKLNERYHLLYSNCQNFASFVFEKLSHGKKKWSTVTSAAVDRIGLKKKKIQPKIKVDAFKYQSILKDENFDFYRAMMEGRRKDFEELINDLTIECLNDVDSQGYTLLEWATVFSSSDWPIDENLKEKGAEIRSNKRLFRRNLFFIALQYLPPNKKLLSFDGIDIRGVNRTGDTALHMALYGEKWEIAGAILCNFEDYDVNLTNSLRETPLHLAAKLWYSYYLFTKILERTNPNYVNKTDRNGNTALHYAMLKKSEAKVEELLKREDVDVDIKNRDHGTALHLASNYWRDIPSDLFNSILEKTTDVNSNSQDMDGHTALHYAITHKSEIMTKALLAHKDVNVNVKNNNNETALHWASKWKDIPVDLFNLILEKSTEINAQNISGWTALYCAIFRESEIATKELLKHKDVNVNVKNNNETTLHLASRWKDIPMDLFKIILKKSTDINAKDKYGDTALHCAIWKKSEIATKELLAHKDVDVNIQNNDNYTALGYVSMWKDIPSDLFKLIKEKKANDVV